jgi:hypothetical protein
VIVSASRRTDIPAHYASWLLNRLRAGWCAVPNPFNARLVTRIPLTPDQARAIVFWTRDPRPLLPALPDIAGMGHRVLVQFTLLEYPRALHPGMPPLEDRLEAFKRLSSLIGPERVLWRYDPILFTPQTPPAYHLSAFAFLCRALAGHTRRVTVSLMEPYRKTLARLARARMPLLAPGDFELASALRRMAETACSFGITPQSCSDDAGLDTLGFAPGACIDAPLLNSLFALGLDAAKDQHQRPACRCAPSRDIGMYHSCPAGCAYCYATSDFARARASLAKHDPASPSLLGWREPAAGQGNLFDG